jgi:hypothetical protein
MKRVLPVAFAYYAIVFGVGFVLGSIRVPLLVPRLGVRTAELLEMPLMAVAIVLAARWVVRRFALPPAAGLRLAVGGIALILLVTTELVLASVLSGQTVLAYLSSRDPVSGSVYAAMLLALALMPWAMGVAARRRLPSR